MQSFNVQYTSKADFEQVKKRLIERDESRLLIQAFSGDPEEEKVSQLLEELRMFFPRAAIIGTTTAGEICDGDSLEKTTILSFSQFENAHLSTALIEQNDDLHTGGRELGNQVNSDEIKLAIIFGCGIKNGGAINGEPLLEGFKESCPGVVVVGGQAGDNGQAQKTYVFTEKGYTDSGAVAVSISGSELTIDNSYNLSWVPLGKRMTITEATQTQIKTIDGRPAKEVYAHYLGETIGDRLPHSAAEFPLVVKRNGVALARHANRVLEDGSLDFMAPFYTGEKVQFAFCHTGLVAESAKKLYNDFKQRHHDAIFIYSCLSRKWVLGPDANLEIAPLANLAPTSGFFSYGEYYSSEGKNMFLSQTMTVLGLSENVHEVKKTPGAQVPSYDFKDNETKEVQDLQALHRLVETSAEEREELIEELKIALAEIKTLQGFIPICAKCKNIRDDRGYWNEIEQYISRHTEAQFSHGICPDCAKELYPELYPKVVEKMEQQKKYPNEN